MDGAGLAAPARMRGKPPLPETGNGQRATGNGSPLTANSQQPTTNRQPGALPLKIGANIAERLLDLATSTTAVLKTLPKDSQGKHVNSQLFRAVTAAGANYEEARSAESPADFVHKLAISVKELRETVFWLRLIDGSALSPLDVSCLITESHELIAILGASIRTVRRRQQ